MVVQTRTIVIFLVLAIVLLFKNHAIVRNLKNVASVDNVEGGNVVVVQQQPFQILNDKIYNVSLGMTVKQHYTDAQKCRLELEKWLNPMIDEFVSMGEDMPPLIDWVWDMDTRFIVNMKLHSLSKWNRNAFLEATWNWQDQFGNNFTIDGIIGKEKRNGESCPILPVLKIPSSHNQTGRSIPSFLWASNLPPNSTLRHWVYDLRPFTKCDSIEKRLDIPPPGTKIGMCVRFRGGHNLVPPFVAYHRLIGVQHFWFYVNEEFNITDLPLASDVTYVPYQFVWSEHKNQSRWRDEHGNYKPWRLPFDGETFWQATFMHQCLYRSKRHGLDWIMTNDIDEYLWVNKLEMSNDRQLRNVSILQEFLLEYERIPDLGGLAVEGWSFGTNKTRQEREPDPEPERELHIDYIYRAQKITGGRRKIIYRVPNAKRIDVHWLREGGKLIQLHPSSIRWNHYRRPYKGIYQLKHQKIVQDSSLPDTYRESILESMRYATPTIS